MRGTVRQKNLLKEIDMLRSIAGRKQKDKNSLAPKGIRFEVSDSKIILSATDLTVTLTTTCNLEPLTTSEPGSVVVPGARLHDIIRGFDNVAIDFELLESDRLRIRCGGSDYKIACEDIAHFPALPRSAGEYPISVPTDILLGQIIRTKFAIPDDSGTSPGIKGIVFSVNENMMSMMAVDSFQFALVKSNIIFSDTISAIIPSTSVDDLSKFLSDVREDTGNVVEISSDDSFIFFKLGDRELGSRLLEGNPPDIIGKVFSMFENSQPMVILVEQFSKALQRAANMADDRMPAVNLDIDEGELTIYSESSAGEAREKIMVASNGLKMKMNFNTKYLLPTLGVMKTDKAQIDLIGPGNPALIRPIGEDKFDWKVVVMSRVVV